MEDIIIRSILGITVIIGSWTLRALGFRFWSCWPRFLSPCQLQRLKVGQKPYMCYGIWAPKAFKHESSQP